MNVNGVRTEFVIIHQGNPDPSFYDASCGGAWVLMKDCWETRQWHSSNGNDYANSTIHSYLNGDFLNLFDAAIKGKIKQVKIPYVNGTGGSAVASGASGLSTKIFLLGGYEVGWATSEYSTFPVDGAKLSYFENGSGTSACNKRIAYLSGSATSWWLRSPDISRTDIAWYIYSNGMCNLSGYYCTASYGVRPACILPSNLFVDGNSNVTAEEVLPPVQCRIPRKMSTERVPVTLTLEGTFNSTYNYVTASGTMYTSAETLTVDKGTTVTVVVGSKSAAYGGAVKITLNDTIVAQGSTSNYSKITYELTVTDNCKIEMAQVLTSTYTATITMPYTG